MTRSSRPLVDDGRRLRRWRMSVFAATWLSYVGMYFARKPFYMVKSALTEQLGLDARALADIGGVYLTAYTVGQFCAAAIGSWIGARRMLLAGMTVSALCNVVFGARASYSTLMLFMALHGMAQATGWSGNVGTMAYWTTRRERGTVMGLWATCYQLGGILANGLASFLLGWRGWRWSFYGGAGMLGAITVVFALLQRNRPEDVGLPPLGESQDDRGAATADDAGGPSGHWMHRLGWDRQVVITLLLVGGFYFCVKFIRYALWSWAPYFLRLTFGLAKDDSGYLSTVFDLAGFFGAVSAGVISDRLFRGRRSMVAFIMLIGMALGCLLLWNVGSRSLIAFGAGLAVVGFMLYGPDSLLTGAGAIDLSTKRGAIAAAGVINGMGAIGSVVQEHVIGGLYEDSGGQLAPIFLLMLAAASIALAFIGVVLWRNRKGASDL